jgi:hypothetical protein
MRDDLASCSEGINASSYATGVRIDRRRTGATEVDDSFVMFELLYFDHSVHHRFQLFAICHQHDRPR